MAKEYGYYIEGNKLGIVERDTSFDNNVDSKEFGPGVARRQWKSPLTAIAKGLEIKYAYSPKYFITDDSKVDTNLTSFWSSNGKLVVADLASSYTNYGDLSGYNIADGSYIVLRDAGEFSGLHKVVTKDSATGTNNVIYLDTIYSGTSNAALFDNYDATGANSVKLYYYVDVLNDEADELNIPSYLEKALVYYVKGRLAEDAGNIEVKEYMMREYKKHIEEYETSLVRGPRIISSGYHAIR
jgi:hypothetical protein